MKFISTLLCDFYKTSHMAQYPEGTEKVYSTWTPRMTRIEGCNEVVAFGFQGFIKEYLIEYFQENFFSRPIEEIEKEYVRYMTFTLGMKNVSTAHIAQLHRHGKMPVKIMAVPEGTKVPIRVPMLTIENTSPEFFWVTNYLETLMSTELWSMATSATIADRYRKDLTMWSDKTCDNGDHLLFQGHDFSMRGMTSLQSATKSGASHLLSFAGTDTIPSIMYHEQYYNANIETELVGASIPATEHSVQCIFGNDEEYFNTIMFETYPTGLASIVSDGYDYWKMLSDVIAPAKDRIMARDGKVVIRPDSGDPIKIICGDADKSGIVKKGTIEYLWDVFGGTINSKGYKVLDPHIGAIYGDSITVARANAICSELEAKGFASSNIVFGIGSYTYQYNTRDTFGFALKATYAVVNGEEKLIFKDPKTDNGVKKSQRGLVATIKSDMNGKLGFIDGLNRQRFNNTAGNIMRTIYNDGELLVDDTLEEIRLRIRQ